MDEDEDDGGQRSEPEEDGLELAYSLLITVKAEDRGHPLVKQLLKTHKRRLQRAQQIKGFTTWTVRVRKEDLAEAIARALEPYPDEHLHASTPTMVMRTAHLYRPAGRGFVLCFTGAIMATLVYSSIGAVQMIPIGQNTVFVYLPEQETGPAVHRVGGAVGSQGLGLERVIAMLKKSNELMVKHNFKLQFKYVMENFASECHWLVAKDRYVAKAPAGGGFLYVQGWDSFWANDKLDRFTENLGKVGGTEGLGQGSWDGRRRR